MVGRGFRVRFMQWYLKKYGIDVGKKKKGGKEEKQERFKPRFHVSRLCLVNFLKEEEQKRSRHVPRRPYLGLF